MTMQIDHFVARYSQPRRTKYTVSVSARRAPCSPVARLLTECLFLTNLI